MSQTSPPLRPDSPDLGGGDRLDSWKEIASYLKREVRTAQRWEKSEGLPVRRHQHDKLSSVFAYRSELDAWWRERQPVLEKELETAEESGQASLPEPAAEEISRRPAEESSAPITSRRTTVVLAAVMVLVLSLALAYFFRKSGTSTSPGSAKTRLVVLPFRNLNGDPAQEVFCEGLTESMTTQLGRLDPDHLGVIASTTASMIKDKSVGQIGKELNVSYVLEGSVLRSGDHVQVHAQLIQVSDQTHRWADTYNRDVSDMFSVQNEVANAIAAEIRLQVTPAEKARLSDGLKISPEAYEAYLQGLVSWNKRTPEGMRKSIGYFQQAIRKDPQFALAWAGLANGYSILSAVPTEAIRPREAMPKAKKAAEEAIRLDPASAEAHAALALVRHSYDWDWDGAEKEYQRAFSINPSSGTARHWHSLLLLARGRQREALEEIELARTLDPLSPVIPSTRVMALYFARDYDRVIEEARKALEVEPDSWLLRYHYAQALAQEGRSAEAISELKIGQRISGGDPLFTMALGHAYGISGDRASAMQSLAELKAKAEKGHVPPLYFVPIYVGLGDADQAMRWLEKAYEERIDYLVFLNVEPMSDPLRSDPRFQQLLHRIGLL
ncbi:MAG TPA: tetratricopeptide repeat protein [Candidatus Acidoferrales bacterium]|nr:tetratricopeptide repeat protein [Candidatus Acidoferrales bacterium]